MFANLLGPYHRHARGKVANFDTSHLRDLVPLSRVLLNKAKGVVDWRITRVAAIQHHRSSVADAVLCVLQVLYAHIHFFSVHFREEPVLGSLS